MVKIAEHGKRAFLRSIKVIVIYIILFVPFSLYINWPTDAEFSLKSLVSVLAHIFQTPLLYLLLLGWFLVFFVMRLVSDGLEHNKQH
jgi:hypothetical protein